MRNKDGVSEKMGCLKHLLGFSTGILEAARYLTGSKYYGSSHAYIDKFQYAQDRLNQQGYTGFEYMGYVAFYQIGEPSRDRWNRMNVLLSADTLDGFFKFKESRLKRVGIRMDLVDKEYQADRNVGLRGPEDIFESVGGNCGYKTELLMRYARDFSEQFVLAHWNKYNYGIGDKFRMSPEMIVVCNRVATIFKTKGGINGFTDIAFAPAG